MRTSLSNLSALGGILLFLPFCLSGCGSSKVPEPTVDFDTLTWGEPVEQFKEPAGVRVSVATARVDETWVAVRAVFTPVDKGYHLYSKDLPTEGIDGIGRPTRIEVKSGAQHTGKLKANLEPQDADHNGDIFPVYPEGPVTLYRLVMSRPGATLTVALTYMSCSSELCNAPVEGESVTVGVP